MKRLGLAAVILAFAVACGNNAPKNNVDKQECAAPQIENFNVEQFVELLKDTTVVLLDVRTPDEFAQGCIEA